MNHAIHHENDFDASPDAIYEVLTDSGKFSKLTGGLPTEIDATTGGAFSCFGGMNVGINVECSPGVRLVQAWQPANWEPGVYSLVRFELKPHNGGTKIIMDHTSYPENEGDHLGTGWTENYCNPLRELFSS